MSDSQPASACEPTPAAPGLPPNPYNQHAWVVGEPIIGEGTWIGAFTMIDASGGLTVGRGCDISSGVHIYTHSSARRCVSGRRYPTVDRAPVSIGDFVFIGANATINMGITIGDHAIIGAGSVVTRDVPSHTVVQGVPARPAARVVLTDEDVTFAPLVAQPVDSRQPKSRED